MDLYYLAHEREKTNQQVPREQTNGNEKALFSANLCFIKEKNRQEVGII